MRYLQYLEEKEKKMKSAKGTIVKAMYLLIPLFLMGTTFVNERIITECEVIHNERVEYRKKIVTLEKKIVRLEDSGKTGKETYIKKIDRLNAKIRQLEASLKNPAVSLISARSSPSGTKTDRICSYETYVIQVNGKNVKHIRAQNCID